MILRVPEPQMTKPNKIIYGGQTLIDLTEDTVTPETLKQGVTAHDAAGETITGTLVPSGGVVQESDINFYDYDGTLLHAWTLAELAGKTALPELPTREGLVCQGWNWTLADLQALGHKMNVGAIYITDDGATRLHLDIPSGGVSVNAVFYQSYAQRVSVDWGDGSEVETSGSDALTTMPHTYAAAGKYIVSIMPLRSSMQIIVRLTGRMAAVCEELNIGKNHVGFQPYTWDSAVLALQKISLPASYQYSTQNCLNNLRGTKFLALPSGVPSIGTGDGAAYGTLQQLSIPKSVTEIKDFAFRVNSGLRDFYAPSDACAIGQRVFENCTALSDVVLPASMTEIKFQTFYEGNQIRSLQIPAGVTAIGSAALFACRRLVSLTLPAGLTTIGANAFYNCTAMQSYDFTACPSIPTLDNANAFTGITSDCEIRVPAALADEWKAATNWATYADHIVGVGISKVPPQNAEAGDMTLQFAVPLLNLPSAPTDYAVSITPSDFNADNVACTQTQLSFEISPPSGVEGTFLVMMTASGDGYSYTGSFELLVEENAVAP